MHDDIDYDQIVYELRNEGRTFFWIADHLGMSRRDVAEALKRVGMRNELALALNQLKQGTTRAAKLTTVQDVSKSNEPWCAGRTGPLHTIRQDR